MESSTVQCSHCTSAQILNKKGSPAIPRRQTLETPVDDSKGQGESSSLAVWLYYTIDT